MKCFKLWQEKVLSIISKVSFFNHSVKQGALLMNWSLGGSRPFSTVKWLVGWWWSWGLGDRNSDQFNPLTSNGRLFFNELWALVGHI